MTFTEAAKIALAAKGIEHGFIHHRVELRKDPKATRNQGGGFNSSHEWRESFRVVLYMDRTVDVKPGSPTNGRAQGGMAETENDDLFTALREAFEILQLPLPDRIPAAPQPTKKK